MLARSFGYLRRKKWSTDELAKIRATPWSLHVPKDTEVVFKDKKEGDKTDIPGRIVIARQFFLKAIDIVKHGLTRGCSKCDHEISYDLGRTSKPHSQTCKTRILAEIGKTPEGQVRNVQLFPIPLPVRASYTFVIW